MRIQFLGIGEAFPISTHNSSVLVDDRILLDCGFDIPKQVLKVSSPLNIDLIFVSHFHGDHFAGISSLLMSCWESGRKDPLRVIGPADTKRRIIENMSNVFENYVDVLGFDINFQDIPPSKTITYEDYTFTFAEGKHSITNFAARIDRDGRSVVYSGDTEPVEEILALSKEADLLIHECYTDSRYDPGHTTAVNLGKMLNVYRPKRLALVHMNKTEDSGRMKRTIKKSYDGKIIIPRELDKIAI